jgi:hypothetical protein
MRRMLRETESGEQRAESEESILPPHIEEDGKPVCPICQRICQSEFGLQAHIRRAHGKA